MNAAPTIQGPDDTRTLVDVLLAEQRTLSAVERFARLQDHGQLEARQRHYRSLLPATAPGPGQQFAFEVDLDECSGCKACVTACHSLNGLDETETWRSVGLLMSGWNSETRTTQPEKAPKSEAPSSRFGVRNTLGSQTSDFGLQHLTTACHHCADPACLNGCPVLAYDKDPVTGIVRHLDDQCIGCQYCVMKCPYDVPKYSQRLGIVRKCDLCSSRLAVGEAPACVQACPNEAIRVTLVGRGVERSGGVLESWSGGTQNRITPPLHHSNAVPPPFPDPSITRPTTRFVTRRPEVALMQAADATALRPGPAHPPLSVMLVLTQLGVGAVGVSAIMDPRAPLPAWLALGVTLVGVVAATLHLGQPLKAWRSFLGWRRSWLSRELLAFGAVLAAMVGHALLLRPETGWSALLAGLAAVTCSAMVYVDTRRAFWGAPLTFPKFALTTVLLGAASAFVCCAAAGDQRLMSVAALTLVTTASVKIGMEIGFVAWFSGMRAANATRGWPAPDRTQSTHPLGVGLGIGGKPVLRKSAVLHAQVLSGWFLARLALGVAGGVLLPALFLTEFDVPSLPVAVTALLLCVAGEVAERHLFFVCEAAPRMPGGVTG